MAEYPASDATAPHSRHAIEPAERQRLVRLTQSWLAEGADHEEVLTRLRDEGISKATSIRVIQQAAGIAHGEAKLLVHNSQAWADYRLADERMEGQFFRALFIMCVLGEGTVNEPAEDVAECRERQDRARRLLGEIADLLPNDLRGRVDEYQASNLLGQAFTEIVDVTERTGVRERAAVALIEAAQALCLDELLGDTQPPDDDQLLMAAWRVLRPPVDHAEN